MIVTEGISRVVAGLAPWLRAGAPVLLVGPEGCGKALLLQHCFSHMKVCKPTDLHALYSLHVLHTLALLLPVGMFSASPAQAIRAV